MPTLELAEKDMRKRGLIPKDLSWKWLPYDDKCDASIAIISTFEAHTDDCIHVIFGPVCEYALGNNLLKIIWINECNQIK